jgi:hypothetical protein
VEEETVATEPLTQALDRAVGDPELSGDLAEGGAGQKTMEDGLEERGLAEPVRRLERL